MEGTLRSEQSESQLAYLHLLRLRGAGSVPSPEHAQRESALQGDRRCSAFNSVILGKTPTLRGLGFLVCIVWKTYYGKHDEILPVST